MYIYIWLDKFIKSCETMIFFFIEMTPEKQPTGEAWAESRITEEDWNDMMSIIESDSMTTDLNLCNFLDNSTQPTHPIITPSTPASSPINFDLLDYSYDQISSAPLQAPRSFYSPQHSLDTPPNFTFDDDTVPIINFASPIIPNSDSLPPSTPPIRTPPHSQLPPLSPLFHTPGGGPRVVVSTAAFHARVRGFGSRSRRFERNKNVSSPSTCES